MARTAASKVNSADAQEWLESLQQVAEGWYRQVALAIRAGAPKAVGMEPREFAASIGQKLVDPRQAIIELFNEGHSMKAIADTLGVSQGDTVRRILAEEGLIEWTPKALERAKGWRGGQTSRQREGEPDETSRQREGEDEADPDDLRAEVERLEIQVKAEKAKRRDETKALKDDLARVRKLAVEAERKAKAEAEAKLTEVERERARKEAEAFASAEKERVMAGLSHLAAQGVVVSLDDAGAKVRAMIDQGAISSEALEDIDGAHAGFVEELNVARASLPTRSRG